MRGVRDGAASSMATTSVGEPRTPTQEGSTSSSRAPRRSTQGSGRAERASGVGRRGFAIFSPTVMTRGGAARTLTQPVGVSASISKLDPSGLRSIDRASLTTGIPRRAATSGPTSPVSLSVLQAPARTRALPRGPMPWTRARAVARTSEPAKHGSERRRTWSAPTARASRSAAAELGGPSETTRTVSPGCRSSRATRRAR